MEDELQAAVSAYFTTREYDARVALSVGPLRTWSELAREMLRHDPRPDPVVRREFEVRRWEVERPTPAEAVVACDATATYERNDKVRDAVRTLRVERVELEHASAGWKIRDLVVDGSRRSDELSFGLDARQTSNDVTLELLAASHETDRTILALRIGNGRDEALVLTGAASSAAGRRWTFAPELGPREIPAHEWRIVFVGARAGLPLGARVAVAAAAGAAHVFFDLTLDGGDQPAPVRAAPPFRTRRRVALAIVGQLAFLGFVATIGAWRLVGTILAFDGGLALWQLRRAPATTRVRRIRVAAAVAVVAGIVLALLVRDSTR